MNTVNEFTKQLDHYNKRPYFCTTLFFQVESGFEGRLRIIQARLFSAFKCPGSFAYVSFVYLHEGPSPGSIPGYAPLRGTGPHSARARACVCTYMYTHVYIQHPVGQ